MRGDIARLGRCTAICTQGEDTIRRSKPFKYAYEKEIVMYAQLPRPFRLYSSRDGPQVRLLQKVGLFLYRVHILAGRVPRARTCVPKDLEAARPSAIIDIIHSGEAFEVKDEIRATQKAQRACISPLLLSPL